MDDGTVEFLVIIRVECLGVCPDRIEADEQVTRDLISFRIIEGDDIRVIIVLEILAVYLQYLLVGTEDIADISRFLSVCLGHCLDPAANHSFLDGRGDSGDSDGLSVLLTFYTINRFEMNLFKIE